MNRYPQTDHQAAAAKAQQSPATWILATIYRGAESGQNVARMIRNGNISAYRPKGTFEAYAARHDAGTAVWIRCVAGLDDVEPLKDTVTVRVPDYGTQRGYEGVSIAEVEMSSRCPRCGAPRGPLSAYQFVRDGSWLTCDQWENPCGHQDEYSSVLAEARTLADRAAQKLPEAKRPKLRGVEGGRYAAAVDIIADAIEAKPSLRARRMAALVDEAGHTAAAHEIHVFVSRSSTGPHTSARAAALYLNSLDEAAAEAAESAKHQQHHGGQK